MAVSTRVVDLLHGRISTLAESMVAATRVTITPDEFVRTFVPAADRITAIEAPLRFRIHNRRTQHSIGWTDGVDVTNIQVYALSPNWPMFPEQFEVQPDADPEVINRITSWVTKRIDLGRKFGLAKAVLDDLAEICDTFDQVRFLWPVVQALADGIKGDPVNYRDRDGIDRTRPHPITLLQKQLAQRKTPRMLPKISPDFREACQLAGGVITAAGLLGKDCEFDTPDCDISIPSIDLSKLTKRWSGVSKRVRCL